MTFLLIVSTGMNGSISVKQADVVLDTFPLNYQNNYTQDQKLEDLDYVSVDNPISFPFRPSRLHLLFPSLPLYSLHYIPVTQIPSL